MIEAAKHGNSYKSARLDYKAVELSDAEFVASLLLDSNTMKYINSLYTEPSEVEELIIKIINDSESDARTIFFFILYEKDRNIPVGIVNMKRMCVSGEDQGILGYIIKDEFCGKGYATEASTSMIEYGFSMTDVPVITASTVLENCGSENVLKKCGMKFIGISEESLEVNGTVYDEVCYRIYRDSAAEK